MTIRELLQDLHKAAAKIGADSDVEIHGMMRIVTPIQVKTWTEDVYSSAVIIVNTRAVKHSHADPYALIKDLKNKIARYEEKKIKDKKHQINSRLKRAKKKLCQDCGDKLPKNYTFIYCDECRICRREKNKQRYHERKSKL